VTLEGEPERRRLVIIESPTCSAPRNFFIHRSIRRSNCCAPEQSLASSWPSRGT
jgi:hypothetical protein